MFSARSQSYGMRCTLLEAGTNPLHKPIWKLLGVIVCAVILSVFTAASAFSQGTPTLAGSITGQGQQAAGVLFLDVKLSNTGTDTAQNVKLTQVLFRTLGGTGTASYNTSLSPALPLSVGTLAAGANTTVRIFLNLPSTITRFSITETGTLQNSAGTNLNFSIAQSVIPPVSDTVPPIITATITPSPNAAGWNNSPVTVTFTCSDANSGVASCPAPVNVSNETPGQLVTGTAKDNAGNSASASVTVKIDITPPSILANVSPAPNAAGWNNSNLTITFSCSDALSGVVSCPAPIPVSTEGALQFFSGTVQDQAGNSATAGVNVNLDKTPPTVGISAPAQGANVYSSAVTVSGSAGDSLSGIANVTCNGIAGVVSGSNFSCSVTLSSNSITALATDVAGNSSSGTVSVTQVPAPIVTITSPGNLSFTNINPTTVRGTVNDPNATVTVNGVAAPASSGSFTVQVPLTEGSNTLTAVARNAGGNEGKASVLVTLDTTPPHVTIASPSANSTLTDSAVTVTGTVNDIVVGTVNDQDATVAVSVNGGPAVNAQVANRTFSAAGLPLALGANTIQAQAHDRVGNSATASITLTRVSPQPQQPAIGQAVITNVLSSVSGNNQAGTIGTQLPAPLVVLLSDSSGNPVAGQPVVFKITGDDGTVGGAPAVAVNTAANGQAQVLWTLGHRSGAGINTIQASSALAVAPVNFSATGLTGSAAQIVTDSGDNQSGATGQALTFPLVAVVTDSGHNRVPNVPVTFTVINGGGTLNGANSQLVNTDSDGRAQAVLTLGSQPGSNVVEATFAGNPSSPVAFSALAKLPGNPANTTISGIVLDNSNAPIQNVTIRLFETNQGGNNDLPVQIGTPVVTDGQGRFLISNAPFGYFKLMADGSTVVGNNTYPTLEYDIVTVAGQDNSVGMPIYLPVLDTINKLCVDETHGGTLTLPASPGFALTVPAGTATFPGGSRTGCITVSTVHGDKVPMAPGFGQQPRFIVSIQPVGTIFNPPAPITLPNVDGLAPRAKTEMYSYDHDLSMFVAIGTGTVSADGSVIVSDPGVGVLKAGWHCGGDPNAVGHVADCGTCNVCTGNGCKPDPQAPACNEPGNVMIDESTPTVNQQVQVMFDDSCKGACQSGDGKCNPNAGGFNFSTLQNAVKTALSKIYDDSAKCMDDELRFEIQNELNQTGIYIQCSSDADAGECAHAENSVKADGSLGRTNTIEVNTAAMKGQCNPESLPAILLHEMIHGFDQDPGAPNLRYHDTVGSGRPIDCRDRVYGCEESCFPGSTVSKGTANPEACKLPAGSVTQKGDPGCNGPCAEFNAGVVCTSH